MAEYALGMIETVGLAAAIEAADTGVKSANVKLLGYELTRGNGLVTVKFAGNVGAVKAAIEAGSVSASKVNKVWSKHIIPRPHDEIEKLINNLETVGNFRKIEETKKNKADSKNETEKKLDKELDQDINDHDEKIKTDKIEDVKENTEEDTKDLKENVKENEDIKKTLEIKNHVKQREGICNICGDPKCPRRKGEPRILCIHYKKKEE